MFKLPNTTYMIDFTIRGDVFMYVILNDQPSERTVVRSTEAAAMQIFQSMGEIGDMTREEIVAAFCELVNPFFNRWYQRKYDLPCAALRIKNQLPLLHYCIKQYSFLDIENMNTPTLLDMYLKGKYTTDGIIDIVKGLLTIEKSK